MKARRKRLASVVSVTLPVISGLCAGPALAATITIPTYAKNLLNGAGRVQSGPTMSYAQSGADTVADIYVNGNPSVCRPGATTVSQWFANKYAADGKDIPILWNVGDFTGFYPTDNASTQHGLTNAQYGGTAIQMQGLTHGWQIETTTAVPDPAASNPGFIAGIIGNHQFCDGNGGSTSIKPFANPYEILVFSVDMQVPYSNNSGGTVNTASQMVYMIDPIANLGFWYSFADFSSVSQSETVIYDVGTDSAIVGTFPGTVGKYASSLGGSGMQMSKYSGYKTYRVAITPQNLRNAIDGIKAAAAKNSTYSKYQNLSEDPSVYQFGGGILDTEVARVNNYDGGMGLSAQNTSISLLSGGVGCSSSNTQVAWSCGNGQPNSSWTSVGGGCYEFDSGQACQDRIVGNLASVKRNSNGTVTVSGWTCAMGSASSLTAKVYVGSTLIGSAAASVSSEAAVGQACLDPSNSPHRFSISISSTYERIYRGKPVVVSGVLGVQSAAVAGSGSIVMP